jgi:hypothetical protein
MSAIIGLEANRIAICKTSIISGTTTKKRSWGRGLRLHASDTSPGADQVNREGEILGGQDKSPTEIQSADPSHCTSVEFLLLYRS